MEDFKEVLLVVNPIAGDTNKDKLIEDVKIAVGKKNAKTHIFRTTGNDDKQKIKDEIASLKIERVLVAGGDGTINLVAEAIKDLSIPLGIISAGSANGLALNLQIPKLLKEQIQIALSNNFIEMDILCLNDVICLHMSDLGINAELVQNYETSTVRGKFGYLLQSVPTLIKSEFPFEFCIKTERCEVEREGILLCFANANKYGTGANINPKGNPSDGIFEILIFKRFDIAEILKTLRNEVDLDSDFVEIIPATKARITCKKPIAFQIDGEYIGKETSVEISVLPEKLKIAVPKDFSI